MEVIALPSSLCIGHKTLSLVVAASSHNSTVKYSPICLSFTKQNQTNNFYTTLQFLHRLSTKPRRKRLVIVANGLGNNSNRKSIQDDEVKDLGVKAALSMLKFYKREISPLLPNSCRYQPTCSEYSMEAYKRYGVVKGSILTAWRLCRCNPLGGSGFDPPRWFDERRPPEQ